MGRRIVENTQHDQLRDLVRIIEGTHGLANDEALNQQFSLKSYVGVSRLRDRLIEDGTEVTDAKTSSRLVNALGEYEITCPAGSSNTEFLSAQFGQYEPGFLAMASLGVRIPSKPNGDAFVEWGYGSDRGIVSDNRFAYGWDASEPYVFVDKNGDREIKAYQSDWNLDTLDGSGPSRKNPSGLSLDVARGNVYRVLFTWYGYGDTFWVVKVPDDRGIQHNIPIHVFTPNGGTSIAVPDAPVGVYIDSGTTGESISGYVAGRAFGLFGGTEYPEVPRVTTDERIDASIANGTWTPVLAVKRKLESEFATVAIRPQSVDLVRTNNDITFGLFVGDDPDDGTFEDAPVDGDADETTLRWNRTATSFTPALPITRHGAVGGGGSNVGGSTIGGLDSILPDRDPLILAAKGIGSTATVSVILNMEEAW